MNKKFCVNNPKTEKNKSFQEDKIKPPYKTTITNSSFESDNISIGKSFESGKRIYCKSNRNWNYNPNYTLFSVSPINQKKKKDDLKYLLSDEYFNQMTTKNFQYSFSNYIKQKLGKNNY